jgi:Ca-activated chloride channel family protein
MSALTSSRILLQLVALILLACQVVLPGKGRAQLVGIERLVDRVQTENNASIKIDTDLVTFNVSVTDRQGRAVSGLDKSAFIIYDDKVAQQITFFSDEDGPVSVGILFDMSGSMSGAKIDMAREALSRFIQTSSNQDDFFLIGFNSRPRLLVDTTRDADQILRKLSNVLPKGDTAMLDAVYVAAQKVQRGSRPKRALLLITDGGENDSRYKFNEVQSFLAESDLTLYSICVLDRIKLGGKAGARVQNTLNGLSEVTSGRAFYPQSSLQMDEIFEQIALELRHRYSIGYRPVGFASNGKWHNVKVTVSNQKHLTHLLVRSKKGYYASTQ